MFIADPGADEVFECIREEEELVNSLVENLWMDSQEFDLGQVMSSLEAENKEVSARLLSYAAKKILLESGIVDLDLRESDPETITLITTTSGKREEAHKKSEELRRAKDLNSKQISILDRISRILSNFSRTTR